jgi:enterochelin esterase family protein
MADGSTPPANVDGSFIIGPTHDVPPEMSAQSSLPKGRVIEFSMSSAQSKIDPGIARDANTFGTVDPADPAELVMTTSHPAPYTRRVAVYVPRQYVPGSVAPFIVGADSPDPLLFSVPDTLIAQHKVPAMIAISIGNGSGTRKAVNAVLSTTPCPESTRSSWKRKCCLASKPRLE